MFTYEYENQPLAEIESELQELENGLRNYVAIKQRVDNDPQYVKQNPHLANLDLAQSIIDQQAIILDKRAQRDVLTNPVQQVKDQILAEIEAKQIKQQAIDELVQANVDVSAVLM